MDEVEEDRDRDEVDKGLVNKSNKLLEDRVSGD